MSQPHEILPVPEPSSTVPVDEHDEDLRLAEAYRRRTGLDDPPDVRLARIRAAASRAPRCTAHVEV